MLGLQMVVFVGIAILIASVFARRFRIAPPVLLLAAGVLLGFVPQIRDAQLPPEIVLLVLLPVLLYWESLTTSLREIRRNFAAIGLLSTALVVFTAWAVAAAAHALGLPWGPAWVLGAAVAPTDATAIAALARFLPRRQVTVLRAESLVNDGTALVIYGIAVGITVGEEAFSPLGIGGLFLLAYGGGAFIWVVVAWINMQLRRRLQDPLLGNLVMLLAPFTAFLLAELVEASGVVAVVVSGLIMSQVAPRIIRAEHRIQALAFWPLFTFIINGSLFVLVGVELQFAARNLSGADLGTALIAVAVVCAVVVAARFGFLLSAAAIERVISRVARRPVPSFDARTRVVSGLAGFRGAVSLAVALSVPTTLASGAAFPERDFIIFVTAGVVLITLVVQGVLLPFAVRWARIPADVDLEMETAQAEILSLGEAIEALPELARERETDPRAAEWARQENEAYLSSARARGDHDSEATALRENDDYVALSLEMIGHRRSTIIRLRDQGTIDDTVLRRLQALLDDEEMRLVRREPLD